MNKTNKITVAANEGHFQGEIYIGPVISLPAVETKEAKRVGGALILGYSETGHHHVVETADAKLLETSDPLVCYLVAEGAYADLVHKRDFDTHPTLSLLFGDGSGVVPAGPVARKVVRQREMTPSGWVRAQD